MDEFIAVIVITILAVISPGADFAVVTKNSYLYGRKIGILTSLGIAVGVLIHVLYTLCAISLVLSYTPYILHIIKYLGAMYLIYIGYKTFIQLPVGDVLISGNLYPFQAFKNGVLTNALNPKTTLFVISTYTQIVSISTPKIILIIYGGFMSFAHFVWFSIVALVFSIVLLREKMLNNQIIINKAIGSVLCALGVGLLATQIR